MLTKSKETSVIRFIISRKPNSKSKSLRHRLQISLPTLSEFKQINQLTFPLKSSANRRYQGKYLILEAKLGNYPLSYSIILSNESWFSNGLSGSKI